MSPATNQYVLLHEEFEESNGRSSCKTHISNKLFFMLKLSLEKKEENKFAARNFLAHFLTPSRRRSDNVKRGAKRRVMKSAERCSLRNHKNI